jgi:hypothetical protein
MIESFRLTGTPASGPFMLIDPSIVHVSAALIMTSVKQFVFAWALSVALP